MYLTVLFANVLPVLVLMPMLLSPKLALFRPVCQKRADTVPYGAIVIQALLNRLGATEFYVSNASNLEAVLNGALDDTI